MQSFPYVFSVIYPFALSLITFNLFSFPGLSLTIYPLLSLTLVSFLSLIVHSFPPPFPCLPSYPIIMQLFLTLKYPSHSLIYLIISSLSSIPFSSFSFHYNYISSLPYRQFFASPFFSPTIHSFQPSPQFLDWLLFLTRPRQSWADISKTRRRSTFSLFKE